MIKAKKYNLSQRRQENMKITDSDGIKKDVEPFFDKVTTGGRPRKVFTKEGLKVVESLSRVMATDEDIAGVLGCSRDIFYNEENKELYRQAKEKGMSEGKLSLRRKQFEMAMKGNSRILEWLGRQWLKQTERIELDANVSKDEKFDLMEQYINGTKGTIDGDNRSQV